ncbi:MAG: hypothetical protein GEU74_06090 [Nitriliruptorales bacterium]|nr:hypothetical protein [Nitriliruptorales bacterium]
MSIKTGSLRHDALLYATDQEFTDAVSTFIREGVEQETPVITVTTQANIGLLCDALGSDADQVEFVDAQAWYQHPLHTIDAYRRTLDDRLAAGAPSVRVVGEVQFGETDELQRDWLRYEAALNQVFADAAAWIVCPYDERTLPASVVEHAGRTHPHVWRGHGRSASQTYTDPWNATRQLLTSPQVAGPVVGEIDIDGDLSATRTAVRDIAAAAGLQADRVEELTLAVTEVVTNALVHGVPPVLLRFYNDGAALTCDISDNGGGFIDPLAGFLPPADATKAEGGRGLWLSRHLSDRLEFVPSDGKTVLRLSKSLNQA